MDVFSKFVYPSRIRFNERRFFHVDFLDEYQFKKAIEQYEEDRASSPIFEISAGDEVLNGYSEKVEAIYTYVCENGVLLRYYKMREGDKDDKQ